VIREVLQVTTENELYVYTSNFLALLVNSRVRLAGLT